MKEKGHTLALFSQQTHFELSKMTLIAASFPHQRLQQLLSLTYSTACVIYSKRCEVCVLPAGGIVLN